MFYREHDSDMDVRGEGAANPFSVPLGTPVTNVGLTRDKFVGVREKQNTHHRHGMVVCRQTDIEFIYEGLG
jgi:hypothetical protein